MAQYSFSINESSITELPSNILSSYKPGNFGYDQGPPERRDLPLKMWYVDDILDNPDSFFDSLNWNTPKAKQFGAGYNSYDLPGAKSKNLSDFDDKRIQFPQEFNDLQSALFNRFMPKGTEFNRRSIPYSNTFRMYTESDFNKWEDNYWWPHQDKGNHYACLIYMNKEGCDGTNIYKKAREDVKDSYKEGGEHTNSWRSKEDWDLLFKSESKYNRAFIFPGWVWHGMAHNTNKYTSNKDNSNGEYRNNLAIFI